MAENTNDSQVVETEEELTNYTTETNAGAGTGTSAIEPGYGTGRRKELSPVSVWFRVTASGPSTAALWRSTSPPSCCSVRSTPRSFCSSSKASSTLSSSLTVAAPPARLAQSAWRCPRSERYRS